MAETVIDATQFDINNIKYTTPKVGGAGGKSLNILNKSTRTRLNLSTPVMLTWGVSDFVDPATGKGNGKFEMSLQFPSDEYKNDDTNAFLENMKQFEQKIKDDALTYSKEWFGKVHKAPEVIDALYTPMLKYSKDKSTGEPDLNKSPSLRVKLPVWEGAWRCEVYDEYGTKLFPNTRGATPVELIPKATQLSALITCGGIWFANGKFGVTWKLVQAMVQKPRAQLSGQCFLKVRAKDPEQDQDERSCSPEPGFELKSAITVDDSDCDEEEHSPDNSIEFGVTTVQEDTTQPVKRKVIKKKSTNEYSNLHEDQFDVNN